MYNTNCFSYLGKYGLLCSVLLACICLYTSSVQASSWDPTLLVNTEAFQEIDPTDTTSNRALRFGEGVGAEQLFFDVTNNVFSFTDDVHVEGNLTSSGNLTLDGTITINNADPALVFDVPTLTDTDFWTSVIEDASNDDDDTLQIGDGNVPGTNPFVAIDTDGNVGIGTTSPETTLEVVGTISGSSLNVQNLSGALVWYLDDAVEARAQQGAIVTMPFGMRVTGVDLRVKGAPTGSSLQVDINENGTSIYSTPPEIDAGTTVEDGNEVLSDTVLTFGSEITIDIDQIGSTFGGSGLTIMLKGRRQF